MRWLHHVRVVGAARALRLASGRPACAAAARRRPEPAPAQRQRARQAVHGAAARPPDVPGTRGRRQAAAVGDGVFSTHNKSWIRENARRRYSDYV